jgi:hypothetical protein
MERDFATEIKQHELQLDELKQRMEIERQRFLEAASAFFRDWYWTKTEELVKQFPEITKALGRERLGKLKADLRTLQERTPDIVSEHLGHARLWWNLHPARQSYALSTSTEKSLRGEGMIALFSDEFGYTAGALADVLKNYDYITDKPVGEGDLQQRTWKKDPRSHYSDSRHFYRPFSDHEWPESLKAPIGAYHEFHRSAKKLVETLERTRRDQARSEATRLWDEA